MAETMLTVAFENQDRARDEGVAAAVRKHSKGSDCARVSAAESHRRGAAVRKARRTPPSERGRGYGGSQTRPFHSRFGPVTRFDPEKMTKLSGRT